MVYNFADNIMKKMFLILSLVFITSFVSCDKGNKNTDDNRITISGKWGRTNSDETMTLGANGSYYSELGVGTNYYQYRKGRYVYNDVQSTLVVDIDAVPGQNSAYTSTYLVQTLTETTLVLVDIDGDLDSYYYTRIN